MIAKNKLIVFKYKLISEELFKTLKKSSINKKFL